MIPASYRRSKPGGVTLLIALFSVFGGINAFFGAYFLTRGLLSSSPVIEDMTNDTLVWMGLFSVIVGSLFMFAADRLWRSKDLAWEISVGVSIFAFVLSILVQLVVTTGQLICGVSWLATIVSLVALAILYTSGVRGYPRRRRRVPRM